MALAGVLPSYCGKPPWCFSSGPPAFCACNVAVSASIFRSSSATRLSAFFWRLRVGGVVMLCMISHGRLSSRPCLHTRVYLPLRIACMIDQDGLGRSEPRRCQWRCHCALCRQLAFSPRHESHALGRLKSPGDLADPGVACALFPCVNVVFSTEGVCACACAVAGVGGSMTYPSWSPSSSSWSSSSCSRCGRVGVVCSRAGSSVLLSGAGCNSCGAWC